MAGDASAYAALGLKPGADAIAIERAYKRLIKQHHPDREGGDAARAAEIIHAYRELRRALASQGTLILVDEPPVEERRGGWMRVAPVLLIALAALLVVTGPGAAYLRQIVPSSAVPHSSAHQSPAVAATPTITDTMDQPLHVNAVDDGVRQAVALLGGHDDIALLSASRDCHRSLREEPSMLQLDRCAAFDDAVVQLQNRDPMWDEGPFSQIAVTSRQWSDAAGLSNDYLAIDSRLDRIRVQVELALAPPVPPRLPQAASLAPLDPTARATLTSPDANADGVIPPATRPADGNAALPDQ